MMLPVPMTKTPIVMPPLSQVVGLDGTIIESGMIWKPNIMNKRGHHVLSLYSGLKYPNIYVCVSPSCLLPVHMAKMEKLSDEKLTTLSESSSYRVSCHNNFLGIVVSFALRFTCCFARLYAD